MTNRQDAREGDLTAKAPRTPRQKAFVPSCECFSFLLGALGVLAVQWR